MSKGENNDGRGHISGNQRLVAVFIDALST